MSDAQDAFKEAQSRIDRAISQGIPILNLSDLKHLAELPPDIERLTGLQELRLGWLDQATSISDITPLQNLTALQRLTLNNTQVADITPLQNLTALQGLYLNNTQVTDITPLQNLTALHSLDLDNTKVMDITPLQNLTALQRLYLNNTQVTDIKPLQNLAALQRLALIDTQVTDIRPLLALKKLSGCWFANTPATAASEDLKRLSLIEDNEDRTTQTLAFLRTLPPWPEPLPWEVPQNKSPTIPESPASPITIVDTGEQLRLATDGADHDPDGALMAREGWHAITDYMEDLADQRHRIDNAVPRLGKAMSRLETALGDTFDQLNPIAAGTHGNRVIRLSGNARANLMDEDADDIEEFAAALGLFLERFPEWRSYRDAALANAISADDAKNAAELSQAFEKELEDQPEIDPAIPAALDDQAKAVVEDPSDLITSAGLLASLSHTTSALAKAALPVLKWAKAEAVDVAKLSWSGLKKAAAVGIAGTVTTLAAKAVLILTGSSTTLQALAAQYPQLSWLTKFFAFFGL